MALCMKSGHGPPAAGRGVHKYLHAARRLKPFSYFGVTNPVMGIRGWFLACFLSLVLTGLALPSFSPADQEKPVEGDWLINHLSAEPATLNPITATDAYASNINGYIYESLLKRNEKTLELEPVSAASWEISADHLLYTFHLKKHVHWEDGHPFTAKDVQFSFERIRDPKVDAAHLRNYYRDIEELEVLDGHTVRFRYRIPYFLALEFCGGIPIVPAHLLIGHQ